MTMAGVIAGGAASGAGHRPQQDAGGAALQRVPDFFPENAVEYFVSYYDYYQPEAYVASRDLYIEKDSLDQRRRSTGCATPPPPRLLVRRDVIVVARELHLRPGLARRRTCERPAAAHAATRSTATPCCASWSHPVHAQRPGPRARQFRVEGETLEVFPADAETAYRVALFGDEVESLARVQPADRGVAGGRPGARRRLPGESLHTSPTAWSSGPWRRSPRELNERCA